MLLQSLGAKNYKALFTGSATEANNLLIKGISLDVGERIWVSHGDHPGLVHPAENLTLMGMELKELPLKDGRVDFPVLQQNLGSQDRLIVFSQINNSTGHIQNLPSLCKQIKDQYPQIHIHVDGVQSFGKFPISLDSGWADSLTVCGHKMGGPKGVGALVIKSDLKLTPILWGGGQEFGLRPGTLNVPALISWQAAMMEAQEQRVDEWRAAQDLKRNWLQVFESAQGVRLPFDGNDDDEVMSPYILLMQFAGIPSDIIMRHLERDNIFVSSSSACSSKSKGENSVYTALQLPRDHHGEYLRISFSASMSEHKVVEAAERLRDLYSSLRRLYSR
jgi:cysteine desulfurase